MSADNYIYVRKRDDGTFGVSMRFASGYYEDDDIPADDDLRWQTPNDEYGIFETAEEALVAAHRAYRAEAIVEYGVVVGDGVV